MIGTPQQPGNMVLTMQSIFDKIKRPSDKIYKVKMSYLEIYNEMIHDLLRGGGSNPEAAKLDLREDPNGHVNVAGLSTVRHAENMLDQGCKRICPPNRSPIASHTKLRQVRQ